MAEHKYTSVSHLLKDQKPPKLVKEESEEEIPLVTDMFGELYFRERSSSSPSSIGDLKFSPPLPSPKFSTNQDGKINEDELNNGPKGDVKKENLSEKDSCKYNNSTRLFPPPISTLRMGKTGEPFTYQRFDDSANAFVREEIKVPPQGVMAATRANGRLRMKFADGQEEKEATEAVQMMMERNLRKGSKIRAKEG